MESVRTVCNWTTVGGDWGKAIQKQFVEDEFLKPNIDDFLKDENAILLRRKMKVDPDVESETCELQLSLFPRFKISGLSIICTVPKIEIYLGPQNEYYETEFGCVLDDDAVEENDNAAHIRCFRYDIEIDKSGITEVMLKLLTPADEICIFAILMHIAPNPNGVTTLSPNSINLDNVQKMLEGSNHKLTPKSEKCKKFIQMYGKVQQRQTGFHLPSISAGPSKLTESNVAELNAIKDHIDNRMNEFESKMFARFDAFESQQTAKLNEILSALQARK